MPHAKIASKQATYTLEVLHAELAGKILDNQAEGRRLVEAMKHVEAVLKLLDPGYDVRGIAVRRRKPNPWFKRGTVLRHALDALRTATQPVTSRELALMMLETKGVQAPARTDLAVLTGAVSASLQNYKGRGVVTVGEGMPARWRVSP